MSPETSPDNKARHARSLVWETVQGFCNDLAYSIIRESEHPSRPELRRRLQKISEAATLLIAELSDTRMSGYLYDETEWNAVARDLVRGCRDLQARAAGALAKVPTGPGRGKHYADSTLGPDAREFCALIVSIAWQAQFGRWPGQRNPEALKCCEALWTAAGGAPHGGPAAKDGALTAWRKHLVAAHAFRPPHNAGRVIERNLAEVPQRTRPKTPDDAAPLRLYPSSGGTGNPPQK